MDLLDQNERERAANAKERMKQSFAKAGKKAGTKFSDAFKANARQKAQAQYFQPMMPVDLTKIKALPDDCIKVLANNLYIASIHIRQTSVGVIELMSIRAMVAVNTKRLTWAEKNRIKNEVYGDDRVMLECYPAAWEGAKDDAFWFWVQPVGVELPFAVGPNKKPEAQPVAKKLILPELLKK